MTRPLFVGGFPSGGTDLLKNILNAHPAVYLNGEMPQLRMLLRHGYSASSTFRTREEVAALSERLQRLDPWGNLEIRDADLVPDPTREGGQALSSVLYHLFSAKPREVWGNKTPQNTEHLAELRALFPSARFLIIVRDVRDVCLSWKNKWGKDVLWCADKWARRMRLGMEYGAACGSSVIKFIRYEDLLIDPEAVCRDVVDFLNLPFSENMLSYEEHVGTIVDGKINYGRPLIRDNFGKWRQGFAPATVRRIEEIAYGTMSLFDYTPEFATAHHGLTRLERVRGTARDVVSTLTVGNRARRDNSLASRLWMLIYMLKKRTMHR